MPEGAFARGARDGLRRRWRSRRFVVRDDSMRPAFVPGDRLYADPRPGRPVAPGDVVVVRDPERAGHLLLKRVAAGSSRSPPATPASGPDVLELRGDNLDQSRDSRQFGRVPLGMVVGVVWFRYAPPERRGPVTPDSLN